MKTRTKGKAIIGIAMAAVIVVALMAMAPTASAAGDSRTIDRFGNTSLSALIGEKVVLTNVTTASNVAFTTTADVSVKTVNAIYANATAPYTLTIDSTVPVSAATYTATVDGTTFNLTYSTPTLGMSLKIGATTVTSVTKGENLTVEITGNIDADNNIDLNVIRVSDNVPITEDGNGKDLTNVAISTITAQGLNTTGWVLGEYKITATTEHAGHPTADSARGLEITSNEVTVTIVKPGITITSSKDTAAVSTDITIKVQTAANTYVNITTGSANVTFKKGFYGLTTDNSTEMLNKSVGNNGIKTYVVEINKTGSYTFTATRVDDTTITDTVTISVVKADVTLSVVSATVVKGEKIKISGTTNTGQTVDIFIEKTLVVNELSISDGTFSKDIPTADATWATLGSIKIEAKIDSTMTTGTYDSGEMDASTAVLLTKGDLTATQANDLVAQGDKYKVTGTATGVTQVKLFLIGPKGGADAMTKIYTPTTGADDTFEEEISIVDTANSGTYTMLVISAGNDHKYGSAIAKDTLPGEIDNVVADFGGKTSADIIEMVLYYTTGQVASGDLSKTLEFKVAAPVVTLDDIADVAVGEDLVVTGTSNRADDTAILITVKGPDELAPQSIKVVNGVFNTTFATAGVTVGTYTVKVDDGDGHTDTATVDIVTEVAPAPTATPKPTAKPTAAPAPTAKPTAAPTATPTATPEPPGFEAVFAIAGLLSIAYLVLRKRRE